jgi:ADP-ribose pyrophosphatase
MTPAKKSPSVVTAEELRKRKKGAKSDALIDSADVYAGKIITLERNTVRYPDGSTAEVEIVRHPGASAVVPFLNDPQGEEPQVLLLRQYRYAAGGYLYEIPAGRLDEGESPEACAVRELKEETGCTAERMEPLTSILTTPGFSDEIIHLFLATGLTHGEPNREADEFVDVVIMRLSEALERISAGEMTDSKTVLALLFVAGFKTGY